MMIIEPYDLGACVRCMRNKILRYILPSIAGKVLSVGDTKLCTGCSLREH